MHWLSKLGDLERKAIDDSSEELLPAMCKSLGYKQTPKMKEKMKHEDSSCGLKIQTGNWA